MAVTPWPEKAVPTGAFRQGARGPKWPRVSSVPPFAAVQVATPLGSPSCQYRARRHRRNGRQDAAAVVCPRRQAEEALADRGWHPGGHAGQPCAGRHGGCVAGHAGVAADADLDRGDRLLRVRRLGPGARQVLRRLGPGARQVRRHPRVLRPQRVPHHAGGVLLRRDGRQDPAGDRGAGRALRRAGGGGGRHHARHAGGQRAGGVAGRAARPARQHEGDALDRPGPTVLQNCENERISRGGSGKWRGAGASCVASAASASR